MNRYNHPLNNPHIFFFELQNSKTYDVAYTLPYSIDDEPTEQDVDDIAKHLVEAIKTKRQSLGWNHSDLFRSHAYLYDLSKRVRCAVYCNSMFDYAPVEDFKDIQDIKEHYTWQFGELFANPPWRCVNGDAVKPTPETLT